MCHIFFIHPSVDGHLGCFHVLAIVNSANAAILKILPPKYRLDFCHKNSYSNLSTKIK